jgi:hypothetical protein
LTEAGVLDVVLLKAGPALAKALSGPGYDCSDEEVGLFINTALYLAVVGKSPTAAYVVKLARTWCRQLDLWKTAAFCHFGALGTENVADCGDNATAPRRRQPGTAVSAISELEGAVSQVGKIAYVQGRSSMGMDDDLVRSSATFSGAIDFKRMPNPKKWLGFLHSVIASGGSGAVLSSRSVRRNGSQKTSTEFSFVQAFIG